MARGAGGGSAAGFRTRSAASSAAFHTRNLNLGVQAENRLFETQLQVEADILTALGAAPPPASPAEQVAEPEKVAEDIAKILEGVRVESTRAARGALQSGMAEAIIGRAFLRIAENAVGFGRFLEFFFSVRIVGIAVRVELQR